MFKQKPLWRKPALFAGIIIGAVAFSCQQNTESPITGDSIEFVKFQSGDIIPGKYIVTLMPTGINFRKDLSYDAVQATMRKTGSELLSKYRIDQENLGFVYGSSIEGFAVSLTEEQYQAISKDPSIKAIEADRVIALGPPPGKGPGSGGGGSTASQQIPYGIERVHGGATYTGSKKAYIIDSGIDSSHEDLNVSTSLGFNAFTKGKDASLDSDGNGHGTHVAGTVGAKDNSVGVIGVAAGVTVIPVKVLDSRGSGSYSGVIAGVDFVKANATSGDVANMSLGGPISDALDAAVVSLAASGVKVALAAGNESDNANNHSPARANHANIYTISAIDSSDKFASFSNYGNPPIDFAAPGVGILSTVPGGYASYSGTSMASPHVCGLLIWGNPGNGGNAIGDPDGNPDQIAIR
ncbi:peptidase inhibitor I9 [Algoriphagus ratkowskyi]|uniref:Peptidase inhibitor I9 n=1 Tax=Algoriphagus ratkowskyi TaxID=57028 RepID=A0A2W7R7A2_9BACT|nr:S8 family peptidase [Algoriphagus ratkowskyi]PZX56031.1 peptidase inhibitor I9 [Algoriphagus ratkowskyi]TXD77160.1 S8 family peptidase [Algoriphagus ratkowskyi]